MPAVPRSRRSLLALTLGGSGSLGAQTSAAAAWQATPASVLKSALRSVAGRPGALPGRQGPTRRRSRSRAPAESGVRVEHPGRERRRLAGQGDARDPARPELRGVRGLARRASRRRAPTATTRWRAKKASRSVTGCASAAWHPRGATGRGRTRPTWMVQAWKWGAGSLSAGAALVCIISSVRSLTGRACALDRACAPAADTAWALGDTIQLAITITDAHGGIVPGVRVGWTSTDTSVASVDSAGTVVARSPGAATVVAAAGGRIAQSRILVRPRPGGHPAPGRLVASAWRRRRVPPRRAGGGRPAASGVRDRPVTWRSSDPRWPSVDSAGRRHGRHRRPRDARGVAAATSRPSCPRGLSGPRDDHAARRRRPARAGDQRLAVPVRAQIVSRGGRPMAGVPVRFAVADSRPGGIAPDTDTSNTDGIVQAAGPWATGRAGSGARSRSTASRRSRPCVAADAEPVADNASISAPASLPPGPVTRSLAEPIGVRVTDSTGAPLGDVPVSWETAGGGRSRRTARGPTRSAGAGALDTRPARGRAAGLCAGGRFARRAARPRSRRRRAGGRRVAGPSVGRALRGIAGRPLCRAVQLRVSRPPRQSRTGRHGRAPAGEGTVAERTAVTDSTGRVAAAWTLGPAAGLQRLTASARASSATGGHGAGDGGRAGKARARRRCPRRDGEPAVAAAGPGPRDRRARQRGGRSRRRVLDRSGTLTPTRARTDSAGRARTRWVLGRAPAIRSWRWW